MRQSESIYWLLLFIKKIVNVLIKSTTARVTTTVGNNSGIDGPGDVFASGVDGLAIGIACGFEAFRKGAKVTSLLLVSELAIVWLSFVPHQL